MKNVTIYVFISHKPSLVSTILIFITVVPLFKDWHHYFEVSSSDKSISLV